MKPSFEHLDALDRELQQEGEQRDAEAAAEAAEADKEEEMKKISFKIRSKETERSAAYRKLTHAYIKEQEDQEPWVNLAVYPATVRTAPAHAPARRTPDA